MSKRLQVVMDDEELEEIREAARRDRLTVSEWVRQSLREARSGADRRSVDEKLAAVRRATRHRHPTAEIGRILEEIAAGAISGTGPR